MSAWTKSFTANRSAPELRRSLLSGERNESNLEDVKSGIRSPLGVRIFVNDDEISGGGWKDVERKEKEMVQLKSAPETYLLQDVLILFGATFLILVVATGLGVMDRKCFRNSDIADLGAYVNKTSTMTLQPDLEIVDNKFEIEDKIWRLRGEIASIEDRIEFIKNAIDELNTRNMLSREDLASFQTNFVSEGIRASLKRVMDKEILKISHGLGRVGYRLAVNDGANVVDHSETFIVGEDLRIQSARCFPLKGNTGFLQIKLNTAVNLEAVTLQHVDKSLAYDRSNAPRDCRVYGGLQGWKEVEDLDAESSVGNIASMLLTEFRYDLEKSNVQSFNVFHSAKYKIVDTLRFEFTSNHGDPSYTCIYGLNLHAHKPTPLSCFIQLNRRNAPVPLSCIP